MKRVFNTSNEIGKKGYDRFVGFHINEQLESMLNLVSLSNNSAKSVILRKALKFYFTHCKDIESYIKKVSLYAYHIYMAKFLIYNDEKNSLITFRKALQKDLQLRSLSKDIIQKIMNQFNERIKQANEKESSK